MDDRLAQLLDRQAIVDQMHTYVRWVDLKRVDEVAKVFTDDCRLNFRPDEDGWFEGHDALIEWLSTVLARYSATTHAISNIEIRFDGPTSAHASSYVQVWHAIVADQSDEIVFGRYFDVWARTEGGWLIKERRFKVVGKAGRAGA
jgi:hypothetical protein